MKINTNGDLRVVKHGRLVTEISTIYNNKFVRKLYVGVPEKQAVKQFEGAIKKGTL